MIFIDNKSLNPYYHHALEEFILTETDHELFMLWKNPPNVLIGRNQNIYKEVDLNYCEEEGISVIRRLSGGGAIYCDLNCFQFSFISKENKSFREFAEPVIRALHSLGIEGEFSGRNDILVKGRKISGNAQYHYQDKILHHGTILYDIDEKNLENTLSPNPAKFKKRNLDSARSRVFALKELLEMTVDEFMNYLISFIREEFQLKEEYILTAEDLQRIHEIQKERYESDLWNYGRNPKTEILYTRVHDSGILEYSLNIHQGILREISIQGDFFGEKLVEELEEKLLGVLMKPKEIQKKLEEIDVNSYIEGLSKKELLEDLLIER